MEFNLTNYDTCKWCSINSSTLEFEDVKLCNNCHVKAESVAKSPTLCGICQSLLTKQETIRGLLSEYGLHHYGADGLRIQADNGCELCRMFLLQDPNPDPARLPTGSYLMARRPDGIDIKEDENFESAGDINSFWFSSEKDQFSLELSVSACQEDPASKFISQRPPETRLDSEPTNEQIHSWLSECMDKHSESISKQGQPSTDRPYLPTRVIDVGTPENPHTRLFEPSTITYEHYLTLSYCWGIARFLTTLNSNIDAHKEKLDFPTLPLTFQDAITTTRNLGFRYIWIDALCIIQDSNEDKAKEIGKMGDIYNNAFLTIACVGATRVADGFLKTKPRRYVTLPYRSPDGTISSVQVTPQKVVDLRQESLYTRGWCLQENLLSHRLLLYTDTEVIQCESSPMRRGNTNHVNYLYDLPHLQSSPFRRLPANVLDPPVTGAGVEVENEDTASMDTEQYLIWRSIVQNYTHRRLTVASDRLPALDGIAQKFTTAWNDEYLAGHWKRQFIPSLSWRRDRLFKKIDDANLLEYRAPSWSWASIDGPVTFEYDFVLTGRNDLHAKLVSATFNAPGTQTDAAVLDACLIEAARVKDPMNHQWHVDHDVSQTNLKGDGLTDIWLCLLTEGRGRSGKLVRTLALLLMKPEHIEDPGDAAGCFQRIGVFESSVKGCSKLWADRKSRRLVRIV